MLKIRLQRTGRKHEPTFRVVLTDSKNSTKSGKFLEILGVHDPRNKKDTSLKADRILHWISKGAKPSDTLHNFLVEKGIIKGEKINVLPKKTPIKNKDEEKPEQTQAQTPVTEETTEPEPVAVVQEESSIEEVKEEMEKKEETKEEVIEAEVVEDKKEEVV